MTNSSSLYHNNSVDVNDNMPIVDFDPNDDKYRCCCNQSHATTGVRIIAGMLCITVLFELWHLIVTLASGGSGGAILGSLTQLLIGALIAATVFCALFKERAAYLIPYLVLQVVGLAAGAVFLVAFVYISLFGNGDTIMAFIESHGNTVKDVTNDKQALDDTLGYMSWLMVASFACVLALQIWLISIVFACWRFYRDKTLFGCLHGYMSYVVVRPSIQSAMGPLRCTTVNKKGLLVRMQPVDETDH